ncbi:MAG: hypothetical protein ACLSB9_00955 [Hydrogeniiclostridium mannosilyticum]
MDVKEIQELAKLMEERRLSSLEIVDGEFRLRLNREPANTPVVPCETRPAGAGTATASCRCRERNNRRGRDSRF